MNIFFLIGFMGAGKSYWGKQWAQQLGFSFVELDALVETHVGKPITQIFAEEGEPFFRQRESELLKTCADNNTIVATGGGAPCFFDNMAWMNTQGITVYLKASPHLLAQRLAIEKAQRPLVKDVANTALEEFITNKLAERQPFYNKARLMLEVAELTESTLLPYIQ